MGSGTQAFDGAGGYNACEVTDCIAGYDAYDSNGDLSTTECTKTAAGFYSANNNKERTDCSASPDIPDSYAKWVGTGLTQVSDCAWACDEYYKKDTGSDACVAQEEITTFNIKGLASHPDGISPKGSGSRTLVLEIVATGVTHWHVTPDASFTPNSITDPASVSWNQSDPTGDQDYTLADSVSEGSVTLYLWIAGGTGVVKRAVTKK